MNITDWCFLYNSL